MTVGKTPIHDLERVVVDQRNKIVGFAGQWVIFHPIVAIDFRIDAIHIFLNGKSAGDANCGILRTQCDAKKARRIF